MSRNFPDVNLQQTAKDFFTQVIDKRVTSPKLLIFVAMRSSTSSVFKQRNCETHKSHAGSEFSQLSKEIFFNNVKCVDCRC